MVIIFNVTAFLMLIPAVGAAFALHHFVPSVPEPALIAVAALVAFIADIAVRTQARERKLISPRGGGQFCFVPLWVVALLAIGFAVNQYVQPNSLMAKVPWHTQSQQSAQPSK